MFPKLLFGHWSFCPFFHTLFLHNFLPHCIYSFPYLLSYYLPLFISPLFVYMYFPCSFLPFLHCRFPFPFTPFYFSSSDSLLNFSQFLNFLPFTLTCNSFVFIPNLTSEHFRFQSWGFMSNISCCKVLKDIFYQNILEDGQCIHV